MPTTIRVIYIALANTRMNSNVKRVYILSSQTKINDLQWWVNKQYTGKFYGLNTITTFFNKYSKGK